MFVRLLILGVVAQVYSRPQEASVTQDKIRTPDPNCIKNHQLLPHEYDCTKFYYCEDGYRHIKARDCSPGTEFSESLEVCIHPTLANCTLPGVPTQSPSTVAPTTLPSSPPTIPPTAAPTTQKPSPGEILPNGCPADFSKELLLPHEYDCGHYYQCVHGQKILRPCGTGSHFCYTHQDCVAPEIANCTLSGPSTVAPTVGPTALPSSAPTSAPTSPSTPRPPGETLPNGCPADFSEELLLPHEYDCGQFYQCVHGQKVVRPCAIGSHFCYTHQDCVAPEIANCTLSGPSTVAPTVGPTAPPSSAPTSAPTSPSTPRPPGETLPNGCPADFSEELLLPHEYDCGQFYQCVHGQKVVRPCAIGSHFCYTHQDCVAPEIANCTLSGPSTVAPTVGPTALPSSAPTSAPTSPSTLRPPGETLPNGCPADFSEELLLPHEYDCGQFYQCVHGQKVVRPCAIGSHFCYTHQDCVAPEIANCTLSGPSTVAPTVGPTAPPSSAPTSAPTSPSTPRPPGETLPNGCPADFSEELLLPHEYDCGQFYQCVHGQKVVRPCAIGSHFCYTHQDCVAPEIANCTLSGPSTVAPTVGPTAPPSSAPTSAPTSPSTPRPPGETLPNGCPADFSEELLLPHEYDCGQFYQCVHGQKVVRPCAIGSHFCYTHQDCVAPEIANCTLSGPSTVAPTVGPTAPPSSAPTSAPTSPSTPRPPGETLPNGCPADFSEELLLPHEYDCGQFYQCVHGQKVVRPCAIGSHFCYTHQDCVAPEIANCTLSGPSTVAPTVGPTAPPSSAPTSAPTSPSTPRPPGETLPNGCPADFSEELLLPHEYDCGQFYQCVHGQKVLRPCAIGSYFSYSHQDCVSPDVANCTLTGGPTGSPSTVAPTTIPTASPSSTPTAPSTPRPTPGETLPNGCPADFNEELLLPHEYDCGQYYQCVHGQKVIRPCAIGSYFSYSHQDCVSPDVANCTLTGGPTGSPSTAAPTTIPTASPSSTPTEAPTSQSTPRPPGEILPNGCPADFSEELLLPHEYDCGQYYQCVHGQKVIRPCAIGSYFSYSHQDCVSPDVANCSLTGGPTGSPSTAAPTTGPTASPLSTPTGAPTTPSTPRPSPGETLPNGCPADFSEELLLPHEYDCGQYYQCVHGQKVIRPCAIGSYFSYSHQDCVSPDVANCTLTGGPTGSPSTAAPTTGPTASPSSTPTGAPTTPSTPRPSPGETLPNGCPADFSEELLLPHEYDCGQYYQCVHGQKVIRPCAIGSYFSYSHQDCVSPDVANCTLTGGPTGSPSTAAPTTGPTASPSSTPTGAPTTPSTPRPSPGETLPNGCPADFSEELLLPHEYDCGQYYQCVHGNKVLRPCAIGSHFSYKFQDCISPEEANCTLTGGPTGGPSTGEATTTPTTPPSSAQTGAPTTSSTPRPSPGETLPNGCPADFSEELLLPHEYDCGQYYQCVHGNKVLRPCAIGSHFSYKYQDCISPEEANCTLTGGPTGGPSTGEATTTPTAPPSSAPTGAPTSPSTPRPSPAETLPNGCPANFSEELLLPHEYDCGQYYQCVHGNKVLRPCAIGSHFSYNHQDCISPEEANCTLTGGPTAVPSTGAPTTIPTTLPPFPTSAPTGPSSTPRPLPGETLPNGCPADFSEELLLPHEYDCGQYYQCVHGNKVQRPCAIGSHFSYKHQDCISPEEANCTLTGGPTGGPSTDAPTTSPTAPSTLPSTPRPSPVETLPNGCPADFSEELLLPHEYDCAQYYQCVHGHKIARPCAIGSHFSYEHQDCISPEEANCTLTGGPTQGPSTNSPSTAVPTIWPTASSTAPSTTSTTTVAPTAGTSTNSPSTAAPTTSPTSPTTVSTTNSTTAAPGGGDNQCKTECNVAHWPHETDCDKFWQCDGDQQVLGVCSIGLHFNPITKTCDFICNVECERKTVHTNYNADGLNVFLPWEKVDKFVELRNRGQLPDLGFDLL